MNSKHCPYCNCNIIIRFGKTTTNKQKYKCKQCGKIWTNKSRSKRLNDKIWYDFVFNNMTARLLAEKYNKSLRSIYDILENYKVLPINPPDNYPTKVICVDVTYIGRKYGFLSVLDAHNGICLYCEVTRGYETVWDYEKALLELKRHNIHPQAVVVDGKLSVIRMFERYGLKVQMCQFHMLRIANIYLTRKPVLDPNIELRKIALFLSRVNKNKFENMFYAWKLKNELWLREKHKNEEGKLEYSHQKTRTLVKSFLIFMPYLFTFEVYPELKIPNTNNLIEGVHSALKTKLNVHRGAKKELKIKIVFSFLSGRTGV